MANGEITNWGKLLRKTGLDELPQLINIIKGDMVFFGPRPLTQQDITRLQWDTEFYDIRWSKKPGITGLAQISPLCHKKSTWFWDKYYCTNKSIVLNIYIIFKTLSIIIKAKGDRR